MVFFSQHFKCITPLSSHLHGFLGEIEYNSSICSPIGKVFFPLDCFRMFSLSLTFCNFTVMGIGVFWHLPCFVFSDFPGSVMVSGINLGKFSVTIVSNSSIFFSFFWYSHYVYGTPFVTVPQSWDILLFCSVFFSLIFSFGSFSCEILKFRDPFFIHAWSNKPLKRHSSFCYSVLDLQQFFCCCSSFGFLSLCSHCPSVLACYLPYHQNS